MVVEETCALLSFEKAHNKWLYRFHKSYCELTKIKLPLDFSPYRLHNRRMHNGICFWQNWPWKPDLVFSSSVGLSKARVKRPRKPQEDGELGCLRSRQSREKTFSNPTFLVRVWGKTNNSILIRRGVSGKLLAANSFDLQSAEDERLSLY